MQSVIMLYFPPSASFPAAVASPLQVTLPLEQLGHLGSADRSVLLGCPAADALTGPETLGRWHSSHCSPFL